MLNKYPAWKYALLAVLLAVGGIYASPNLYPDDFAIQVTGTQSTTELDASLVSTVESALADANISAKEIELQDRLVLVRFNSSDDQLAAKSAIRDGLGDEYIAALNMAPTTPDWLRAINAGPMKLGLDLRGGVHFLLEVDMEKALSQRLSVYESEIKSVLREERIRYRAFGLDGLDAIKIKFRQAEERDKAEALAAREYREFMRETEEDDEAAYLTLRLSEQSIADIEDYAVQQNLITLRNRVNELGVAEPLVQRQGRDRIVVELPGVQDTATAKRIIGKTANLEFRLEGKPGAPSSSTQRFVFRNDEGRSALLEKDVIVTGSNVSNANAGFDENGVAQVNISLDGNGGKMMLDVTKRSIKRRMGVLFIEQKSETRRRMVDGEEVVERRNREIRNIINLATIQSAFGNSFRITGLDSPTEAAELALLLRAGSLAAPVYFVEERTVGPSLGQANIDAGLLSVQIGFGLVLIFMLIYYRVFGLIANAALLVNVVLLCALMSMISATLTLPGIAGIVLTVGMAVDANVLIFERIREELKAGLSPQRAIDAGYGRAFVAILDANITTFIAAIILFAVGTGPVKGFAVTLALGILTSMFTAIFLSRAITNLVYGSRKVQTLSIG
ncbi:preprotein translocase subunit SecD [Oleiphilus sp. HI0071]|jgi:preprotein translocase subunit SecD|nr:MULTISPECIES: protein translocase subunit SecD [unclassified Oleiphilus]KZY74873.1 preprotein translocase subunit SecD [Oleiphilus sp. HI0065]KZY82045.1 preprotein translocase subunit SecD [Oleiphilus sp. HI0071]KZY91174.1 preprotein translocase subunit SecD [Oleiphilus sp. HI0073]KZZ40229.1 preprotein translocase subunit SecD [Oleiphilus sp. HI0118]KZZ60357.1 preprotein translocase subunit SecD [Oleiphilus sp. HI0122]KZZ72152.1 preprotein translocase subunit SecD [Oleiphilus sp. HI0130]K